jgi:hypothetical protein
MQKPAISPIIPPLSAPVAPSWKQEGKVPVPVVEAPVAAAPEVAAPEAAAPETAAPETTPPQTKESHE